VTVAIDVAGVADRLRASEIAEGVRRERAVAILRRLSPEVVDPTVEALLRGGFAIVELTFDSEGAEAAIARWRKSGRAVVGAGTIRRAEEVDAAVDAGAQFLVAPTYQETVVERSLELGVPCVPGCFSPTELDSAWQQGATFVKFFPGGAVGPGYLRAVMQPLKHLEVVVTGGVDAGTAQSFLEAGAVAVGVSTAQLRQPDWLAGDFGQVESATRELFAALR
jgi:2-dehydro-3-deoxyphosphogluconate aldolase/(4S)-4-hydroxy-2-oxoglutarate aldolase